MGAQALPAAQPFPDDEGLAVALAAFDTRAWRQLFEEQYQRVFNYAYLRTGNVADAQDVASNVFIEAVKGIGRFSYRGKPVAAWLLRIAHNETVDLLKQRKRHAASPLDEVAGVRAQDGAAARDEWRDVREAIATLKPEHREVLVLRLIEGRSVADVAAMLGKSEGAVKVTQMRALQALRNRLAR